MLRRCSHLLFPLPPPPPPVCRRTKLDGFHIVPDTRDEIVTRARRKYYRRLTVRRLRIIESGKSLLGVRVRERYVFVTSHLAVDRFWMTFPVHGPYNTSAAFTDTNGNFRRRRSPWKPTTNFPKRNRTQPNARDRVRVSADLGRYYIVARVPGHGRRKIRPGVSVVRSVRVDVSCWFWSFARGESVTDGKGHVSNRGIYYEKIDTYARNLSRYLI